MVDAPTPDQVAEPDPREPTSEVSATKLHGMSALSDREIDDWLLMMERLFGKDFLEGDQ